jgi:hypothetical protein
VGRQLDSEAGTHRARPRSGGAFRLSNSKSQPAAFGKIGRLGCLPLHGATCGTIAQNAHDRKGGRQLRVGPTQSPGPPAGNLGGGQVHVHDRTSCNAAVLPTCTPGRGPRRPGLRVTPEARARCAGDLAPTPARPTARLRRGNTVLLPRLDSDADGHTGPRPEPEPSWDTRVGPA